MPVHREQSSCFNASSLYIKAIISQITKYRLYNLNMSLFCYLIWLSIQENFWYIILTLLIIIINLTDYLLWFFSRLWFFCLWWDNCTQAAEKYNITCNDLMLSIYLVHTINSLQWSRSYKVTEEAATVLLMTCLRNNKQNISTFSLE